jgi:hypothetical protein
MMSLVDDQNVWNLPKFGKKRSWILVRNLTLPPSTLKPTRELSACAEVIRMIPMPRKVAILNGIF